MKSAEEIASTLPGHYPGCLVGLGTIACTCGAPQVLAAAMREFSDAEFKSRAKKIIEAWYFKDSDDPEFDEKNPITAYNRVRFRHEMLGLFLGECHHEECSDWVYSKLQRTQ